MTIGGKYRWKANDNPPPGLYDPEGATKLTKPSSRAFQYRPDQGYQKPAEIGPDGGEYEPDAGKGFGNSPGRMTMGGKYKWKPNDNPAPGQYDPADAEKLVRPKSVEFRYRPDTGYKKPAEIGPDGGEYEPDTGRGFGNSPGKMTIGGKYKWKANDNPPPGLYDPESAQW